MHPRRNYTNNSLYDQGQGSQKYEIRYKPIQKNDKGKFNADESYNQYKVKYNDGTKNDDLMNTKQQSLAFEGTFTDQSSNIY